MTDLSFSRVEAFFSSDLIRSKVIVGHSSSSSNQVQRHQTNIAWGCLSPLLPLILPLQMPLNDGKSNGSVKDPWNTGGGGVMIQHSHSFKYYHIHDHQPHSSHIPSPRGLQGPSSPAPFLIKHHYICSLVILEKTHKVERGLILTNWDPLLILPSNLKSVCGQFSS